MAYDAPLENMMKEAVLHEGWVRLIYSSVEMSSHDNSLYVCWQFSDPEASSGSILVTMAPLSLWVIDMQVVRYFVWQ